MAAGKCPRRQMCTISLRRRACGRRDRRGCGVLRRAERTVLVRQMLPYQPGEFYLRELLLLLALLAGVSGLGLLVIDGYVDLDPAGRPGLAAHAHAPFGFQSSAWPRPGSGRPATRWRSYAGVRPGRCSSPRPGCRRPWPPAWSEGIERHHLFPRAYLRSQLKITDNREINQIANMALVEWADNIAISDDAPASYWPAQLPAKNLPSEMLNRQLYWHALPRGWQDMNYQAFLADRRKLMAQVTGTPTSSFPITAIPPSTQKPAIFATMTSRAAARTTE